MNLSRRRLSVTVVGAMFLVAPRLAAQQNAEQHTASVSHDQRWTVELRGGFGIATNPSAGFGQLPTQRAGLNPSDIPPDAGPVRPVWSWLFGDGPAQINQFFSEPSSVPRIQPLDLTLKARSARRGHGIVAGVSISHRASSRLTVDFNLDWRDQTVRETPATADALAQTRASFVRTFQVMLSALAPTSGPTVSALVTDLGGHSHQLEATGTLTYYFAPSGRRVRPFVLAGAGALMNVGAQPSAKITADYQFAYVAPVGVAAFHQTDAVTIHFSEGDRSLSGVVGIGLDWALSTRTGLRLGARFSVAPNHAATVVDAVPATATSSPSQTVAFLSRDLSIAFSNGPQSSTLSGPALTGFKSFSGTGLQIEPLVSVGYFFRF